MTYHAGSQVDGPPQASFPDVHSIWYSFQWKDLFFFYWNKTFQILENLDESLIFWTVSPHKNWGPGRLVAVARAGAGPGTTQSQVSGIIQSLTRGQSRLHNTFHSVRISSTAQQQHATYFLTCIETVEGEGQKNRFCQFSKVCICSFDAGS